jgi:hypothetical protein
VIIWIHGQYFRGTYRKDINVNLGGSQVLTFVAAAGPVCGQKLIHLHTAKTFFF